MIGSRLRNSDLDEEFETVVERDARSRDLEASGLRPISWTQHHFDYGTGEFKRNTYVVRHYVRKVSGAQPEA